MKLRESRGGGSIKDINFGFLMGALLTVSFGTIQFGYSISSWNTAYAPYKIWQDWDDDNAKSYQALVQSLTTGGSAVGALFSGPLLSMGRWNCIMIANFVTLVAGGLTLIPGLTTLCIGRFLYGVAAGGYSVFCPKYISEIAPTAIKGPAGCLTQICVTLGILIANALGLIGFEDDGAAS